MSPVNTLSQHCTSEAIAGGGVPIGVKNAGKGG